MPLGEVTGAWRLKSDHQEGLAILSKGFYCSIIVDRARMKLKPAHIGEHEMLEAYKTMTSQGGTYKIEGNKIRLNRQLSRGLDSQGHPLIAEFVVNGDTLEAEEVLSSGEKSGVRMTWTRVE